MVRVTSRPCGMYRVQDADSDCLFTGRPGFSGCRKPSRWCSISSLGPGGMPACVSALQECIITVRCRGDGTSLKQRQHQAASAHLSFHSMMVLSVSCAFLSLFSYCCTPHDMSHWRMLTDMVGYHRPHCMYNRGNKAATHASLLGSQLLAARASPSRSWCPQPSALKTPCPAATLHRNVFKAAGYRDSDAAGHQC